MAQTGTLINLAPRGTFNASGGYFQITMINLKGDNVVISKWGFGVIMTIVIGAIGWTFQIERRISSMENNQISMSNSLGEIKSDIHDIRNFIISDMRIKVTER